MVLENYNDKTENINKDKISTIFRDNRINKLTISKKINNRISTVRIQDSYGLLKNVLDKLGIVFNVSMVKGKFPYKFST